MRSHGAPALPLWLWGQRAGALLAVQAARNSAPPCNLLLWQPVTSGQGRAAAVPAAEGRPRTARRAGQGRDGANARRAGRRPTGRGRRLHVLHPALCSGLEAGHAAAAAGAARAHRVGRGLAAGRRPSLLTCRCGRSASAGRTPAGLVRAHRVHGPAFWQTTEIEDAPALLQASVDALAGRSPSGSRMHQPLRPRPVSSTRAGPGEQAARHRLRGRALVGIVHHPHALRARRRAVTASAWSSSSAARSTAPAATASSCIWRARWPRRPRGAALRRAAAWATAPARCMAFEQITPEIGAAIDALQHHAPQLRQVVLWGLCDAASAALLYLHDRDDPRVRGLCLLNPWVRSPASLARTQVKHYYTAAAAQREFWAKLLSRAGVGAARAARAGRAMCAPPCRPAGTVAGRHARFQQRMARSLEQLPGAGAAGAERAHDYTAKEFTEYASKLTHPGHTLLAQARRVTQHARWPMPTTPSPPRLTALSRGTSHITIALARMSEPRPHTAN
jgi:hypothetical protein